MLTQKQTANVFIQFFSQIPSQTNQKESAADKINWKEGLTWEETYSSFYRLAIFSYLNQITWYDLNCKMLQKRNNKIANAKWTLPSLLKPQKLQIIIRKKDEAIQVNMSFN